MEKFSSLFGYTASLSGAVPSNNLSGLCSIWRVLPKSGHPCLGKVRLFIEEVVICLMPTPFEFFFVLKPAYPQETASHLSLHIKTFLSFRHLFPSPHYLPSAATPGKDIPSKTAMESGATEKRQYTQPEGVSYDRDAEKGANVTVEPHLKADGSHSDSDDFQDGVQRVRAITTIWTTKTLWSMFAL